MEKRVTGEDIMKVRVKDLLSLLGVAAAAVLSALILLGTLSSNALLGDYGLIGIFVMALLSHLTIIARGLFLPAFLSLTQIYNPLTLGLAAGLGGGIGEMITYCWGLGIKKTLTSINEHADPLPKWAERYGLIVALLFASSPLPDTPIMLLAGALRFPPHKICGDTIGWENNPLLYRGIHRRLHLHGAEISHGGYNSVNNRLNSLCNPNHNHILEQKQRKNNADNTESKSHH